MDLHLCLTTAMADILDEEEVLVCCRLHPISLEETARIFNDLRASGGHFQRRLRALDSNMSAPSEKSSPIGCS